MSGFQDNNEIKIDVVYTKTGRQYKAAGSRLAIPKKIAFSDDGVDYNLYEHNQVDGKRGLKIERTPLLSACTSDSALMKYKLLTLPKQTSETISTFTITQTSVDLIASDNGFDTNTVNITVNYPSPNGFRIILYDTKYLFLNDAPNVATRRIGGNGYSQTGYNETNMFNETLLMNNNTGMNKRSQTIFTEGVNTTLSALSFEVKYSTTYSKFTKSTPHKTKIIVESIDTGFTKELDVTLTKETN